MHRLEHGPTPAGTQNVWCLFLIYLAFSRFANIKLGAADEKPRYNDFTWFSMLFTCGVAVGLYVFGVAEPLYFYRTTTAGISWSSVPEKTPVDNDAQRAQQAIFMAVYHWGIHGWVPYVLLALLMGVVSFRWGLPMTIRSCFYPLIGDHALGLVGDFIDALSISTTTFGVCTSLGLGVTQLAKGMQFLKDISCSVKDNCIDAGGTWDITKYGKDNCFCATEGGGTALWGDAKCTIQASVDTCQLAWLSGDDDAMEQALYTIIALVTGVATLSVLSGLDRGVKVLSAVAFMMGAIVLLCVTYADNTWYVLNVSVQTTGYYLQHLLQVGFDSEAFQQLNYELEVRATHPCTSHPSTTHPLVPTTVVHTRRLARGASPPRRSQPAPKTPLSPDPPSPHRAQDSRYGGANNNYIWGSDGDSSSLAKLAKAGFDVGAIATTADCGIPNPCTTGIISAALAKALYAGAASGATTAQVAAHGAASAALQTYRMSATSVATTHELFGQMLDAYGSEEGVPCGSAFKNGTHLDEYMAQNFDFNGAKEGQALCETATDKVACAALWKAKGVRRPPALTCQTLSPMPSTTAPQRPQPPLALTLTLIRTPEPELEPELEPSPFPDGQTRGRSRSCRAAPRPSSPRPPRGASAPPTR
jgi:hypothetical protein